MTRVYGEKAKTGGHEYGHQLNQSGGVVLDSDQNQAHVDLSMLLHLAN